MTEQLQQIAAETYKSAQASDWQTFRASFADNATIRQNVGAEQSIDEAMNALPKMTADGTTLNYENIRRVSGESHVTQLHDAVFTRPNGQTIRIDICVVMHFNDDNKIVRMDEYLDSAAAAPLFE